MIFNQKETKKTEEREQVTVPMFGYELLREDVLPELLGKEHSIILYWAGKSLARKYPLQTIEDLFYFFRKAGWGELTLLKEKKSEAIFELTSEFFYDKKTLSAPLEAGFLAEQMQAIKGYMTETNETTKNGKTKKIIFHVKWDLYDAAIKQNG